MAWFKMLLAWGGGEGVGGGVGRGVGGGGGGPGVLGRTGLVLAWGAKGPGPGRLGS